MNLPVLACAALVKPPLSSQVYSMPYGYRIDITTDGSSVRGRSLDDEGLLGALTLERISPGDLHPKTTELFASSPDIYQTHIYLREDGRGRGFGIALYAMAFELALALDVNLVSTDEPSDTARRVWKSSRLNALFDIRRVGDRFVLSGMKGDSPCGA